MVGIYAYMRTKWEGGYLQAKEDSEKIKPTDTLILDFYPCKKSSLGFLALWIKQELIPVNIQKQTNKWRLCSDITNSYLVNNLLLIKHCF